MDVLHNFSASCWNSFTLLPVLPLRVRSLAFVAQSPVCLAALLIRGSKNERVLAEKKLAESLTVEEGLR